MKRSLLVLMVVAAAACGMSDEILILDETTGQSLEDPRAAFDWRNDTFMTVWTEKNADNTVGSIVAQRLNEDGTFLGSPYYISTGSAGIRNQPAIAYSPYSQEFLVVYVRYYNSAYRIYGCFCDSSGDRGSLFVIVDVNSSDSVAAPALTYDPIDHTFLLAYTHAGEHVSGSVTSQIYVQRLTTDSTVIGSPTLVSDPSASTDAASPSIASLGHQSLVVWQQQQSSTSSQYNVYGRMFEEGATASGVLPIAETDYTHLSPDVAANERTQEYLVVYSARSSSSYGLYRIYGRGVQSNSVRITAQTIAADSSYNLGSPAVAYEHDNNRFVVAWSGSQSGITAFGSKVQSCRVSEYGGILGSVETLYSETSPFSSGGSVDAVVSDTDIAFVPYRKSWFTSSTYQVLAWRDEYCIDADINCDHHVNLADFRILAESWLVDN